MVGGELVLHPGYAAVKARFPGVKLDGGGMTPAQGRLAFHQERLLFGRRNVHAAYLARCAQLDVPRAIEGMPYGRVVQALAVLEDVAREHPMIGRDPRTGWQDVTARCYA